MRKDEDGPMRKFRGTSNMTHQSLLLWWCFVTSRDAHGWQMAIAGVEGNITYTTTCLERERQEEEELNQQVNSGINIERSTLSSRVCEPTPTPH